MPDIYDNCAIAIAGRLLVEATTVSIDYIGEDNFVSLLGAGSGKTSGVLLGTREMTVSWTCVIPSDSSNQDLGLVSRWVSGEQVTLQVFLLGSGLSIVSAGYLGPPSYAFGVGQNAASNFTFRGTVDTFV